MLFLSWNFDLEIWPLKDKRVLWQSRSYSPKESFWRRFRWRILMTMYIIYSTMYEIYITFVAILRLISDEWLDTLMFDSLHWKKSPTLLTFSNKNRRMIKSFKKIQKDVVSVHQQHWCFYFAIMMSSKRWKMIKLSWDSFNEIHCK